MVTADGSVTCLSGSIDVRYNRFEPRPVPRTKAVMFCLMDVSASMGEREKDLAKRFFILLHLFLKRTYQRVELVFIRHTHEASEVDAQEARPQVTYLKGAASLAEVAQALSSFGVSPRELASILQALKAAGALRAEIVVQ